MAKKNKNDYFKLAEEQIACCVEAAELLQNMLTHYSVQDLMEKRDEMHSIEHKADEIHHDILTRLSAEFITPIDQEDILHLVQIIDDVTDALDEVVFECYKFCVKEIPADVPELSAIVSSCVQALAKAVQELKNFKKPEQLRKMLIEVNTIESKADAIYVEAIHQLFEKETDFKHLIGSKAVYDCLESVCDLCEHAADVIEQIIIKNT